MLFLTFNIIINSFLHHQIITQDIEKGLLNFLLHEESLIVWTFPYCWAFGLFSIYVFHIMISAFVNILVAEF